MTTLTLMILIIGLAVLAVAMIHVAVRYPGFTAGSIPPDPNAAVRLDIRC